MRALAARLESLARRRPATVATALLGILVLVAFANALPNAFVFDDLLIIVDNPLVHGIHNVGRLLTAHYWEGTPINQDRWTAAGPKLYRPLVMATYALNYTLGGLAPEGYRAVNLLLHAAVSVALWALAGRLGWSPAAATVGAVLFAVHPLHTEAVAGVVGRAELLMALGVLGALLWYPGTGRQVPGRGRVGLASLGAFAVGLASKEQAIVLPALLVLTDACTSGPRLGLPRRPRAWLLTATRRYGPYLALAAGYLALRWAVLGEFLGASGRPLFHDNPLASVDWQTRVLTAWKVAGHYLWLMVWPDHLSADYSYRAIPLSHSLAEPGVLGGMGVWGILLAVGLATYVRGQRLVSFAVGLTVIAFLPASNLPTAIGTIMGERLFYLPSAGLCLLAASAWDGLRAGVAGRASAGRLTLAGAGVVVLVVTALLARTVVRNTDWRDLQTLWTATARVVPGSCKVHNNLARLTRNADEVIRESETAEAICPDLGSSDANFNLVYGTALLREGRVDEAIERLETAQVLRTSFDTNYNLALAYTRKQRWPDAEAVFRNALALAPRSAEVRNGLSFVLRAQERYPEALEAAAEALRLKPDLAEAQYNRGRALEGLGRRAEAATAYEEALRLKPTLGIARARLDGLRGRGSR